MKKFFINVWDILVEIGELRAELLAKKGYRFHY